jgi:hypothetical protein
MKSGAGIRILCCLILLIASVSVKASACGEASCVSAQQPYISHFTGPNCDGTESYFLPYDGYAYQCRSWDGGGECGTARRTVTNRSYRYQGVCYPNAWPTGNTSSEFVTVYRDCGEQSCLPAQGPYVSHFTGANCDGTESYYTPYDSGEYSCRTWDGGGQCGTTHRTVTNYSYRYNGYCYSNYWPAGNTLNDFVTVYRKDADQDGLPDSLESQLAEKFFPTLNLTCEEYEGLAKGDLRQLYGLTVPGYADSSQGSIPFVAHPYNPGNGNCAELYQCIEIRYGIAWNWDLGDDTFGGAHRGDSETYAVLIARKDTDGSDWGTTWTAAQFDPSQWRLIKEFMSAHWLESHDYSSFRSQGNAGTAAPQRVWCAEGKHAMYPTQDACNSGNVADIDDCSDLRCDIGPEVSRKLQNVGEPSAPLSPYILFPGSSRSVSPSGTYDVWSGSLFGAATSYRTNLTHVLSWCPTTCY